MRTSDPALTPMKFLRLLLEVTLRYKMRSENIRERLETENMLLRVIPCYIRRRRRRRRRRRLVLTVVAGNKGECRSHDIS
jgi:hypothetical protein